MKRKLLLLALALPFLFSHSAAAQCTASLGSYEGCYSIKVKAANFYL